MEVIVIYFVNPGKSVDGLPGAIHQLALVLSTWLKSINLLPLKSPNQQSLVCLHFLEVRMELPSLQVFVVGVKELGAVLSHYTFPPKQMCALLNEKSHLKCLTWLYWEVICTYEEKQERQYKGRYKGAHFKQVHKDWYLTLEYSVKKKTNTSLNSLPGQSDCEGVCPQ